jgi:acyl-CoA reductase-like NAD-dependent aldehyde dehydrogenase
MIQAQSAPTLKRIVMELGGKSALIVRSDADIARAAGFGLMNFTSHCGQGCALTTRHIVHNSVRPQFVEAMKAMLAHMKIGNPADPSVTYGPLIREVARKRTEDYVRIAQDQGAELIHGGKRPEGLDKGFYFEPTLFDNVSNDSRIAQEEVFGPIGVVIGYDDDDEAIAMANASEFGLAGAVFSADAGAAYRMALRIRTGGVAINGGAGTMMSDAPFGGIKRSGYGREYGEDGLNEFTYQKTISFHAA